MFRKETLLKFHKRLGWSYRRIAGKFKVSISVVQYWIDKYGIISGYQEKLDRHAEVRSEAIRLYLSNMRLSEICSKLRINRSTLELWRKNLNLLRPHGGWSLSAETRMKMSAARGGEKHWNWQGDALLKICGHCGASFRSGRKRSPRGVVFCSQLCSKKFQIEERHPCWKGGYKGERGGRYGIWAKAVLTRCGRECARCGSEEDLHAHHIKPWARFPESRYELENGIALCKKCHLYVHSKKLKPWVVLA